jgi:RNA polymerase sigma-54 factor
MAISQKLELRQGQGLVMTPQLMQAIKLLQLSSLDLVAYVEAELEKNPLLERADPPPGEEPAQAPERGQGADESEPGDDEGAGESVRTESIRDSDEPVRLAPDADAPAYSEWAGVGAGSGSGGADSGYNLEAFVSAETTLADHLGRQLSLAPLAPGERLIGQYLINLVDEAGYVRGELETTAEKLGASIAEVEHVLGILQTFDPPGVGARDLGECLAIQLKERDRYDPAMAALVAHLDLLAKRDFAALKRITGVDEEDLHDMIGEIRRLNPKPGLAFGGGVVQPVVPDVFVRARPNGEWNVELNADTLPRVLINQSYYASVSKTAKSEQEKTFLAECLQTANWLTRSLDQRARTILKVSAEIVRQQDAFLAHGVQHLRPLNLRIVADAIGMHESTVSRVTANKYMATPRGIFELKYFFSSSIAAADGGEAHSAEAVRDRIKRMIDAESADDILSDDTIVQKLKSDGVDIARRTVAKYREAMRIPSSVQRRREKQAAKSGG